MGFIIMLVIIWLLSPFALIPISIIYYNKYQNLKKSMQSVMPQISSAAVKPQAVTLHVEAQGVKPHVEPQAVTQHVVHARKSNPMQVIMIIGVLLLLASSLIFATTTWNVIPQMLKVVFILSISVVFYVASFLAKQKLQLEITSMAFYQLGCFFTPIAILCVGVFRLLGDWFALEGLSAFWVFLVMAVVFSVSTFWGRRIFQKQFFYYMLQISNCFVVFLAPLGCGMEVRAGVFCVLLYLFVNAIRMTIHVRNPIAYYMVPILLWCCVYQGCFLLRLEPVSWIVVLEIVGILFYIGTYLEIVHRYCYLNGVMLRGLTIATQIVVICGGNIEDLLVFTILAVLVLMGMLVSNCGFAQSKVERIASAWGTIGPVWIMLGTIGNLTYCDEIRLLFVGTSITFLIALGLLYARVQSLVARSLFLPMLVATASTAIVTLLVGYEEPLAVLVLWEVILLLFLVRKESKYEIALLSLGIITPLTTWCFVGVDSLGYGSIVFALTGLAYIVWLERFFARSQILTRILGVSACYVGYFFLLEEISVWFWNKPMDLETVLCMIFAGLILLLSQIAVRTITNPLLLTPMQVTVLPFISIILDRTCDVTRDTHAMIIGIITLFFMIVARYIGKELVSYEKGKGIQSIHFFTLHTIVGVYVMVNAHDDIVQYLGGCLLLIYFLQLYKRQNILLDRIVIWISLALGYTLWVTQPFVAIPDLYVMEYWLGGLVLLSFLLECLKVWGDYVGWIQFGLLSLCTCAYGIVCVVSTELTKVVLLGTAMVLVFILAQIRKQLRLLTLSLGTITCLTFYVTRELWFSIAWWVYLLVVGLFLIGVAVRAEMLKGKERSHKITLPNWKW